jgi:uncharacterized membrane protein
LAINLLSDKSDQTSIPFHWTAGIVPFVIAASVFGAARLKRNGARLSVCVLTVAVLVAIYSPILALGHDLRALGSAKVSAQAHALRLIPEGVPVSASIWLGGRVSERRFTYTFPYVVRARWIVVDTADPNYGNDTKSFKRALKRYESDGAWRTVFSSHGIVVLQKRSKRS